MRKGIYQLYLLLKILEVLNIIESVIIKFYNLTIIVIIIFSKGLLIKVISKLYNKNGNNILLSIISLIKAAGNLKVRVSLLSYNLFYPYYNTCNFSF